jgi:phosphoglycerate dehydrogenase-like enzyme
VTAGRVLFAREQISAELSWDSLAPLLPGWDLASCTPDKVTESLDGVDVLCPLSARIGPDVLRAGRFGLVHQFGVGLDLVHVPAATELGIWVARVPGEVGGNADSVAELAVLHLLALARRLEENRSALTARRWSERPAGRSLRGSTIVVVGLGAVGAAVTLRLAPFGARLLGVRAQPELGGPGCLLGVAGPAGLPALLSVADAVICCAELNAGTSRLFGADEFAAMKPGALFVNVARGGLVDEAALLRALDSGQLGGAGLDVFAREPPDPESPLLRHPRVLATPHSGWLTERMFRCTGDAFAANLRRWADGGRPQWAVNTPAFCRARPG